MTVSVSLRTGDISSVRARQNPDVNIHSADTDALILSLLRQSGDYDRGFRLLLRTYRERLYYHVRRMTGNHEDADDVLQNCFIKVYRHIAKFEQNAKLYTWLYRIATNEALTFLEKRKRTSTAALDNDDAGYHQRLRADTSVNADRAEQLLNAAINTLPDKQKAVFNLRYYEEMSYADMSETLETSQGALKASYHHAVKKVEVYIRENS